MSKLEKEIQSFQKVWKGGYRTGYSTKRNQKGLENYLAENLIGDNFLEIGCGGGQWSKYILNLNLFKKMTCVDVLTEEHNNFWSFVGEEAHEIITYKKIDNCELEFLEDQSIDYVFSYDVFCHLSLSTINDYLESLYKKCKDGAILLIMYADPAKYISSEPENRKHLMKYLPSKKLIYNISNRVLIRDALKDMDGKPSDPDFEPRWFWIGKNKFIALCEKQGFKIINEDLNIDKTNPITLFQK